MRKLRVIEFVSVDGVMEAPETWQQPYFDEVLAKATGEGMASTDAYLLGRKTYEQMASFWPTAPADDPYAQHLNSTPKYVASRTLTSFGWEGARPLEGEVPEAVAELKNRPGGDIAVLGSGELVQTLMRHDLVDEWFLGVFPLVLGRGKRLFDVSGLEANLELVSSQATTTGGVLLTYRRA